VKHGESGWIVPAQDAEVLAEAFDRLDDRPQLARMGEAARAAVEPFTIEAMTVQLLELYREVGASLR
jgi:glycosyltransferase involved in cell wall biosynthesis